ncbi:MAG: cytochrome c3 family protein [Ardenticatenales bacterium]|nr:cytochrome c3 family protein [Ardenticatenales bacterium]
MKRASRLGYLIGGPLSVVVLLLLLLPLFKEWSALGPMNSGHEGMECQYCHLPATGTLRQQAQANARYLLGLRQEGVHFGHEPVTTANCLACHERPDDVHPVFRFYEPRFAEARAAIQPQDCVSCHREHEGVRVTIEPTYCSNCHEDTVMKDDPLTIPHEALIQQERWDSCLGCHDFHGNHIMDLPTDVATLISMDDIRRYFDGGPSPYSDLRTHQAKKVPQ